MRAFLDLPNGMAVRIGPAGLLVGRHRSCDIQLVEDAASRRHAMLRASSEGVELVVLGKQPVLVDGRAVATGESLADGALVAFPGLAAKIRIEQHADSVALAYAIVRGGERIQIASSPFIVGNGPTANVAIAGWPDEALRLWTAQGALYVEIDGAPAAPLALGDTIAYRGETLRIEPVLGGDASTIVGGSPHPSRVVIAPLPRGGRLTFTFADGDRQVYLPGRRFQLLSALLAPPAPHVAGEFVPDHVVVPLVWEDDEVGGRQEINVLLTRCRQDLVAAGIAAAGLIERAPGGRATRLVLAAHAVVESATD